ARRAPAHRAGVLRALGRSGGAAGMSASAALLALGVIVVAWLVAGSTAVRSLSRIWFRHWVNQQLAGAGSAGSYLARPQRLVTAAAAGSALTIAVCGALVGARVAASGGSRAWTILPTLILLAVSLLVLGQLAPRAVARRWAPQLMP